LPGITAQLASAPLLAVPLFAALGDETRLRLVMRLGDDGPTSITGLTKGGALTRQAVTKHLGVLEKAGLVRCTRLGRESVWHLERQRLAEAQAWLDARSRERDSRIDRLRALVKAWRDRNPILRRSGSQRTSTTNEATSASGDHRNEVEALKVPAIANDLANATVRPGLLRSVLSGWTGRSASSPWQS